MIVGIDLGTTNSSVAFMSDSGPRLIPNSLGKTLTPSVVGIDRDGTLLTGETARDYMVVQPSRCVTAFKRYMGTDKKIEIADQEFSPEQLSALILQSLKADVAHYFGSDQFQAVVTVPAYFNDTQRQATLNAAAIAELDVVRLVNEPTAAAIAYGFHEAEDDKHILIIDLGGGTFDVSAVEMYNGIVDVRASFGDSFLGGEDFTQLIAAEILKTKDMTYEAMEFQYPVMVSRLKHECEKAKIWISSNNNAVIRIPALDGSFVASTPEETGEGSDTVKEHQFMVWREQFEYWAKDLLERLGSPIQRTMADAGWTVEDTNEVIFVGGSTRMPMVKAMIEDMFKLEPHSRINPDEVVAMGAAVQAGLFENNKALEDMAVTDIAPFSLGVEISKEFGQTIRPGYMLPIISRNRKIPSSQVRRVSTIFPDQDKICVKVYQGEGRRIENCTFLGQFDVTNIPPGQEGQEIDIRFSYDMNGVLVIEATVVATQKKFQHIIASQKRGLTPEDIVDSIRKLRQLKPTPRDEAVWKALLKRAERRYEELSPAMKVLLDALIDKFEQTLLNGDKNEIIEVSNELILFLEQDENPDMPDNNMNNGQNNGPDDTNGL